MEIQSKRTVQNKYQSRLLTTADKILLAGLLLLLPFVYSSIWFHEVQADTVKVWSANQGFQTFQLDNDQDIYIEGKKGKSVLKIQNGKIRFVESKCTSKFCIRSGWLSYAGAFTACLPNQVSLEIKGKAGYDSINF